jgi:hypothetical protein
MTPEIGKISWISLIFIEIPKISFKSYKLSDDEIFMIAM